MPVLLPFGKAVAFIEATPIAVFPLALIAPVAGETVNQVEDGVAVKFIRELPAWRTQENDTPMLLRLRPSKVVFGIVIEPHDPQVSELVIAVGAAGVLGVVFFPPQLSEIAIKNTQDDKIVALISLRMKTSLLRAKKKAARRPRTLTKKLIPP